MTIRERLAVAPFEFAPCGSRVLGTHTHDSDWDYVATYSSEVENFLTSLGFTRRVRPRGDHEASHFIALFELVDGPEKIQVSLESSAEYKKKIMRALQRCVELRDLDKTLKKHRRNVLWDTLYELAGFTDEVLR